MGFFPFFLSPFFPSFVFFLGHSFSYSRLSMLAGPYLVRYRALEVRN